MWNRFHLLVLFLLAGFLGCGADSSETSKKREKPPLFKKRLKWLESYDDALAESKVTGKPVFAFFTGSDWCHYCTLLDHQILSSPAFEKWAKENVVLLELDFPRKTTLDPELKKQNDSLRARYRVTGYPTVLFLTDEGQPILKAGYQQVPAEQWIKVVDNKLRDAQEAFRKHKSEK